MDGWITVGTKIDDSGLDADISLLQKKIDSLSEQSSNIETSMQPYREELQRISTEMDNVNAKADELRTIVSTYDMHRLDDSQMKILDNYNDLVAKSDALSASYAKNADELAKQETKYDRLNQQIEGYQNRINKISFKKQQEELKQVESQQKKVNNSIGSIGSGINNAISKVATWALTVFSVATAYNLVSNAVSTLSGYNEQIGADIAYIQYAIAMMLKPVIEGIINLVYKLLSYINMIAKSWFNVNLFANAGAKDFEKAQIASQKTEKSTKNTAKNLEKQRQLVSGIDEITNLQDLPNSEDKVKDDNLDIKTPSSNLNPPENAEIPDWLKWIMDNGDLCARIIGLITGALIGMKLGLGGLKSLALGALFADLIKYVQDCLKFIDDPSWKNFAPILQDVGVALMLIGAILGGPNFKLFAGIGAIILGIGLAIQSVINYLKDPSLENFVAILGSIAVIAAGIGLIFGGWPALIAAIIGVIAAIGVAVYKNWDSICEVLSGVWDWIKTNVIDPVVNNIQQGIDLIKSIISALITVVQGWFTALIGILCNPFITFKDTVMGVIEGIKEFFSGLVQVIKSLFSGDLKGVLNGFKTMFKGVMDSLWSIAKAPINLIIGGINALIKGINKVSFKAPDWLPGVGGKKIGFNIPTIPKLAVGGVVRQPTQAIIGEAGREAVLPLDRNTEWMDALANRINGGSTTDLLLELINAVNNLADRPAVFNVNGQEIAKATYQDFQNEERRRNPSTVVRRN